MRLLRTVVLSALLVCTASLWAQKTSVDWDRSTNFSQFKTFEWIHQPQGSGFWQQRAVEMVNAQLAAKGLRQVSSNADLAVSLNGATRTQRDLNTFYSGMGGWGWYGMGGGTATTTEHVYQVGTLVLDFFNGHTRKLVWRGIAQDSISDKPEKNQKKLTKAIDKLMKKYPPEQK